MAANFVGADLKTGSFPIVSPFHQMATTTGSIPGQLIPRDPVARPPELRALIGGRSVAFDSVEKKFKALSGEWKLRRLGLSVVDYNDFANLQIIGMGPAVIPYLLKEVHNGTSIWVFALKCITGAEAETPAMHGDGKAVRQAWLEWGKRHGYLRGE